MAFERTRRITLQHTPSTLASVNNQILAVPAGYAVRDVAVRVLTANDGTGTISIGSTAGGTDLATTANVTSTAVGIKVGGVANQVGYAADGGVFVAWVQGTATIRPVLRIGLTLVPLDI